MRAVALIVCLTISACGGSVAGDQPGDAAPDSAHESDVAVTPSVDVGGPIAVETGPATPACSKTNERIDIAISGAGRDASCLGMTSEKVQFIGQILSADVSVVKIDTCHPAADCIPSIVDVNAKAAGLDLRSMKTGSFVEVLATFQRSWACTSMLTVRSVAEWGGMKNPVDGEKTYLVASDGRYGSAPPLNVEPLKTGCLTEVKGSCAGELPPDWYSLRFTPTGGGPPTIVGMGQTATFSAFGHTYRARNLRSYFEGACDAYWDFAWFATSF